MGANEKHAATYHGGEYTPYTRAQIGQALECAYIESSELEEVIDNVLVLLSKVRAEAKAEALNEAAHALDSATINIEVLNGVPDLKQAWAFRGIERKSIIQSLRAHANRYKEQS